ncbi:MAG: serine/threonine-protein phosphatase [Armatimonadetes bacterium]|nr:serine/threonine-protein phosphatase [Armatimonadota bacterium]
MAAPKDMGLAAACESAAGGRSYNEDRCFAQVLDPTQSLWGFRTVLVVADGMGGHERGDQAAQLGLDATVEVLTAQLADHWDYASGFPSAEPVDVVRGAFERANQRIYEWAVTQDLSGDTGTTLAVVVCTDEEAIVGNVGDSRVYLITSEGARKLTEDHSWVGEQVRLGHLTEEEAARSPLRNQLTQAVGVDAAVDPHVVSFPLEAGVVFLACTDGLTDVVGTDALAEVVHAGSEPEDFCRALVALAVAAGTTDNVTVAALSTGPAPAVVEASPLEPQPEEPAAAEAAEEPEPEPPAEPEPPPPAPEPVAEEAEPEPPVEPEAPAPAPEPEETEEVVVEEPVLAGGGDMSVSRQRQQRLGVVLIVCVVSLVLGLLVGRATVPKESGPTVAPTTTPSANATDTTGSTAGPEGGTTKGTEGTPAGAEGVTIEARFEGEELVVTAPADVTLDVYPRGQYRDRSSRLVAVQGEQPTESRYRLPSAPPEAWRDQTMVLKIERAGEGVLKITTTPEAEVFIDTKPHSGDELLEVKPAGDRTRIGFYLPPGEDPKAYAIGIVGFPVTEE